MGADEALNLIKNATTLIVAKGKKLTEVSLKKDRPSDDELVSMMLGPTGNLRAPTMVVGKKVLVGFHEDAYETTFG